MSIVKLTAEKIEGYAVTVEVEGDVQEYAMSFLHIFNNVKTNRELLHMTNDFGNGVTVYCEPESKDALEDYLSKFGKIKRVEPVLLYQVEDVPEYDWESYYECVVTPYFE